MRLTDKRKKQLIQRILSKAAANIKKSKEMNLEPQRKITKEYMESLIIDISYEQGFDWVLIGSMTERQLDSLHQGLKDKINFLKK